MSEPVLELPQLSFGRYLDLLKRRRWQVIPVSLLGLLIGGAVAFFIPRYYVAETRLDYYRLPSEVRVGPQDDPFKFVVDNAQMMLPQSCAATMQMLGWPESREPDPSRRRELESEVENRVQVYDVNPDSKRTYAQLVVSYRDRDGERSAKFLNQLVTTWMEQRIREMREQVEAQSALANKRSRAALDEYEQLSSDLTQLAIEHGFLSHLSEGLQQEELRLRTEALQKRQDALLQAEADAAKWKQQIEDLQRQLDTTRRTLDPTGGSLRQRFPPDSEGAKLYIELTAREEASKDMGVAYPDRDVEFERIKVLRAKLEKLLAETGEAVNPAIDALRKSLEVARAELAGAEKKREALRAEVKAARESDARRAQAHQEYQAKLRAKAEAEKKRDNATTMLEGAIARKQQLESEPPIKVTIPAQIPKRPTEPNILLVAILGCVVGLGFAIGLILAIDTLQGTLKTVGDVERGVPVPVLGGISYLETEEERRRASHSRRRTSLVAGLLLFGAVTVVTIYYVAPHRLPSTARDLLSMVLGG